MDSVCLHFFVKAQFDIRIVGTYTSLVNICKEVHKIPVDKVEKFRLICSNPHGQFNSHVTHNLWLIP